ncbi:MAG: class I SAM-dependent methyltransferase [Candidatus Marinimicrobia bacterium]|nr:class I SAM-dependent methyltransferase [Candidatus Neomarinimicrobiota bacterium]
MIESVKCAICGTEEHEHYLTSSDRLSSDENDNYNIVKCDNCGFLYTNPRPVNQSDYLAPFIEGGDAFNVLADPKSISDWIFKIFHPASVRWKRKTIYELPTIGRLLDFGCRTGDFLFEMKRAKWDVVGIEADELGKDFAISHYGLNVVSSLEEIIEQDEKFDVITMWHTLDKVPDLNSTLSSLKSILNENGFLLIALPNIKSFDARKYRGDWIGLDLPRHLYHFDQDHLVKLAQKNGFEVVKQKNISWDTLHNVFMSALRRAGKHRWNARWSVNWPMLFWTLIVSLIYGSKLISFGRKCAGSGILYYLTHENNK